MKRDRLLIFLVILLLIVVILLLWYFILYKPSNEPVEMVDSCGCRPEYKDKTYGIHPFDYAIKNDPWWEAKDKDVYFNILSRVGYFIFMLDNDGQLANIDEIEGREEHTKAAHIAKHKNFVKTAHIYGTKVDVVFGFTDIDQEKPLSQRKLFVETCVDKIVGAIHQYDFDGVTINFESLIKERDPSDLKEFVIIFINSLHAKLKDPEGKKRKTPFSLNVSLIEETKVLVDKYDLEDVEDKVDIILYRVPVSDDDFEEQNCFDYFVDKEIDANKVAYMLEYLIEGEEDQLGFKYMFENEEGRKLKLKYNTIVGALKSRVGFSLMNYTENREMLASVFNKKLDPETFENRFILKVLMTKYFPTLCKTICPHRTLEWILFGIACAVYITFILLSYFICELKAFRKKNTKYFYLGGVLLFFLFYIIILCDPTWEGDRSNALFVMIIILFGLVLKFVIQGKMEAEYP